LGTPDLNVWSDGRPKDGDWRVSYAIVDPARLGETGFVDVLDARLALPQPRPASTAESRRPPQDVSHYQIKKNCANIDLMNEASPCCVAPQGLGHDELARIAKALSDPIRLGMLDIMAQGRSCCCLPDPASRGVPGAGEPKGICVCEFQETFGLAQSKVSYHLHVLREAGLIDVETRGKWAFYSLRGERLGELVKACDRWLEPSGATS
jgi:ArsR family transcriptional regulator